MKPMDLWDENKGDVSHPAGVRGLKLPRGTGVD